MVQVSFCIQCHSFGVIITQDVSEIVICFLCSNPPGALCQTSVIADAKAMFINYVYMVIDILYLPLFWPKPQQINNHYEWRKLQRYYVGCGFQYRRVGKLSIVSFQVAHMKKQDTIPSFLFIYLFYTDASYMHFHDTLHD